MNLIEFYNENIVHGFEKYHIPDLNLEKAKIVFFLESCHFDEVYHKKPLCGVSGIHFSEKMFAHKIPFGCWCAKPDTVGVFESSPFPLQLEAYEKYFGDNEYPINRININCVAAFQILRKEIYEFNYGDKLQLINHLISLPQKNLNTNLYQEYCTRVANLFEQSKAQTLVICGLFAQRFFNSYLFQNNIQVSNIDKYGSKKNTGEITVSGKTYRLIYINHPKEWYEEHKNFAYIKPTIDKLKEIIKFYAAQ